MKKTISIFLFSTGILLFSIEMKLPFIFVLLIFGFGLLSLVMVIDSFIIKLPESNVVRKWWRKNVVEYTP
jgi:hypothetical protein